MRLTLTVPWLACLALLFSGAALALESLEFDIGTIGHDDWVLHDIRLGLFHLDRAEPRLELRSALITLPPPYDVVSGIRISCRQFLWSDTSIQCRQGQGRLTSETLRSPVFDFSFAVQDGVSTLAIRNLRLLGGLVSVKAHEQTGAWQARIKIRRLQLQHLKTLLGRNEIQALKGTADLDMTLQADSENLRSVRIKTTLNQLTLQALDDQMATDNLSMDLVLKATAINHGWQWQVESHVLRGAGYIDPIYLAMQPDQPVTLMASGTWFPEKSVIDVHFAELLHEGVGQVSGNALLETKPALRVSNAQLRARVAQLKKAAPIYLNPFLEAGAWAGLGLSGNAVARLGIERNRLVSLQLDFNGLNLLDPGNRLQISGAIGQINWGSGSCPVKDSHVHWQELQLKAIPFSRGQLDFSFSEKQISLLKKARLKVLDGVLSIDQFHYSDNNPEDTDVRFVGALDKLSLAQLSAALGWAPLSGSISGAIPAVTYRKKKLELGGALKMHVFDGDITIKKLASSGMFTDFAQFYADIELDNLDLNAITHQFQFGSIEGRLSGYIRDLYLENWQPVSFYAWLGTPENDPSRHRISQKAVKNIASIGGGGAADVISRGFMSLFDTFSYDTLGLGCYLHQGVCQMMGVAVAKNGYYLVKGGGLPRIDVIGYNPRLDWNVLLQRLRRITATDPAVVE